MKILDGKKVSEDIKNEIKILVDQLKLKNKRPPHLAAMLGGSDGASLTYVSSKVKACNQVGFKSSLFRFDNEISEKELLNHIEILNLDKEIDGFIVQLPLPKQIDEEKVLLSINPEKDVDGFHPSNFGRMALEMDSFIPATPHGIIELLERYKINTKGKHCVVLGRSQIVGRPISILMSQKIKPGNATVTLAHSPTKTLENLTKTADIIISALGIPEFIEPHMVKKGSIIIDVGITRVKDSSNKKGYIIKGDVDFDKVSPICSHITPVPGGVGPMTIAMLLKNTLRARSLSS